jgi:uncharacterized membrane protein YsdA (DUF1294 family)
MKALHGTEAVGSTPATTRVVQYLLSGILLSLTAALILQGALGLGFVVAWLITINVVTFIFYRLDKLNSLWAGEDPANAAQNVRIPETSLLLLAIAGGGLAAMGAILLPPRDRSRKPGFLYPFALILVGQLIAILVLFVLRDRIPWL